VKHYATKHNLRNLRLDEYISSSSYFVTYVGKYHHSLTPINLEKQVVQQFRTAKQQLWHDVQSVLRIQICHLWIASSEGTSMALHLNHTS